MPTYNAPCSWAFFFSLFWGREGGKKGRNVVIGLPRAHKNGQLKEEHVTPIEAHSPVKIIKNRTLDTCLATCLCTAVHMCYYF